ncbi:MAG TPA: response regulator [Sulfuricurvum sp.]|nr:response regulator [Sulfuricurvum sp.]
MDNIKLLIVDDVEDNRFVLRAICRKLEGFEIFEAVDGQDAVEKCDELRPHIILMDVMMPRMDGFQASKLIIERYPETIIMAVTAVVDANIEEKMAAIGVAAYIRKPIDKDLIRIKLQSYAGALSIKGRETNFITDIKAINPFSDEIRNFKTIFTIQNIEAIMDFGVWILERFECVNKNVCTNNDIIMELLYELIHQEIKNDSVIKITVEESFSEMFIHVPLPKAVTYTSTIDHLIRGLKDNCIITETMAAFRISLLSSKMESNKEEPVLSSTVDMAEVQSEADLNTEKVEPIVIPPQNVQDVRSINVAEHQVLRESFVNKITAEEYIASIDSDAFGEVHDLREAELAWESWMHTLSAEGREEDFYSFADEVLSVYSNAISALYEFSGLAYAIISLSTLIKGNAAVLASDEGKRAKALLFLEGFKNDLKSWILHVFELKDAQDIHYLDGSFFSSCILIESILTGTEVDTGDVEEIEFF